MDSKCINYAIWYYLIVYYHSNRLVEETGGGAHGAVCGPRSQTSPNLQVSDCSYICMRIK